MEKVTVTVATGRPVMAAVISKPLWNRQVQAKQIELSHQIFLGQTVTQALCWRGKVCKLSVINCNWQFKFSSNSMVLFKGATNFYSRWKSDFWTIKFQLVRKLKDSVILSVLSTGAVQPYKLLLNDFSSDSDLKPRIRRSISETLVDVKSRLDRDQKRENTKSPTLAHMKLGHSRNNSADLNNERALLPVAPPSPLLRKSNLSKGYRYCNGDVIPVEDDPKRKSTGRR